MKIPSNKDLPNLSRHKHTSLFSHTVMSEDKKFTLLRPMKEILEYSNIRLGCKDKHLLS